MPSEEYLQLIGQSKKDCPIPIFYINKRIEFYLLYHTVMR